ncbi:MAG: hypothetical protein WA958_00455 [Tunicatimonas sp.]
MNLLKPTDFPSFRGRAKKSVLRVQNGNRIVLNPQAAFDMGLQANGKKGIPVLIAQDKKGIKFAAASKDQLDESFTFKPAPTSKNNQHPPFALTNAGLARHILDQYGVDPETKSVALNLKADKEWMIVKAPS